VVDVPSVELAPGEHSEGADSPRLVYTADSDGSRRGAMRMSNRSTGWVWCQAFDPFHEDVPGYLLTYVLDFPCTKADLGDFQPLERDRHPKNRATTPWL
jgi:hypothetical protein